MFLIPSVASAPSCQDVTDALCVPPIRPEKCALDGKSCGCVGALHVASNVTRYRAVVGAGAGAGAGGGVVGAVWVVGVVGVGVVGP